MIKVFHVIFILITIFFELVSTEWEYQRLARILHNHYRSRHYANPLYSTKDLHYRAEKCAQYYVRRGTIDHSCPFVQNAGENIWAHWGSPLTENKSTLRSIDSWYSEEKFYRYRDLQAGAGHFTQMVWRGTKALGFGLARTGNMIVAVGIYWPAGNYFGEYTKNVYRPQSRRF